MATSQRWHSGQVRHCPTTGGTLHAPDGPSPRRGRDAARGICSCRCAPHGENTMRLPLLLLPLALAACTTTPAANNSRAATPSSEASGDTAPDAALLGGYHWQLTQATNRL